ncbi:MAG: hypothetical protein JSU92_07495, partial [Deltaproteobacteria bacterium]
MKIKFFTLILSFSLLLTLYSTEALPEDKTLKRKPDPVVVLGKDFGPLIGEPANSLFLYAMKEGKLIPIPFQIDEKDKRDKIIVDKGKKAEPDKDKGLVDDNDELVFMAVDAGDKAPVGTDIGQQAGIEISLNDPLTGEVGWVYLFGFDQPQPLSTIDYSRYAPEEDRIYSRNFSIAYDPARNNMYYEYISMTPAGGGNNTDICDRWIGRLSIRLKVIPKQWQTNEGIFKSDVIGYKDGPVRVVRKVNNYLKLPLGIKALQVELDYIYYADSFKSISTINVPVDVSIFCKQAFLTAGTDYGSGAYGMTVSTDRHGPATLDGAMSDKEMEMRDKLINYYVLNGPQGTLISRNVFPPGIPLAEGNNIYIMDEPDKPFPPESESGRVFVGYHFNVLMIKKGRIDFEPHLYFPAHYQKSDEVAYLNIVDHPLK